jgi:hypothetical protein
LLSFFLAEAIITENAFGLCSPLMLRTLCYERWGDMGAPSSQLRCLFELADYLVWMASEKV